MSKSNNWKEVERDRAKQPLVSFDCDFSTQEEAVALSILIRRNDGQSQTGVMCCEWKDSTPYLISFLVSRILQLWKVENEPSKKVFRESTSHLRVRETERCRILRISNGYDTSMRITDDISLLIGFRILQRNS